LHDLLAAADSQTAPHVRDVIADIEEREAGKIFTRLCCQPMEGQECTAMQSIRR
jgi:hypothetical protein